MQKKKENDQNIEKEQNKIESKEISKEEIKNEEIKTPRKRGRPKNA